MKLLYIQIKFSSNLKYDGKIVSGTGPEIPAEDKLMITVF